MLAAAVPPLPSPPREFRQTIAYVDWYADPLPCVRIFGSTPEGQKACLHLHAVFPYVYVEAPTQPSSKDGAEGGGDDEAAVSSFRKILEALVPDDPLLVHSLTLVRDWTPIYGYHHKPVRLLKVCLIDPLKIKSVAALISTQLHLRVYDAHIGYIPQFLADYHLAGMDDIRLSKVKFRGPLPLRASREGGWQLDTIPEHWRLTSEAETSASMLSGSKHFSDSDRHGSLPRPCRTSRCELELDGEASDVIHCLPVPRPGSLAESKVRSVPSLIPWWDAEEARRAGDTGPPSLSELPRAVGFKSETYLHHARSMLAELKHLAAHPGLLQLRALSSQASSGEAGLPDDHLASNAMSQPLDVDLGAEPRIATSSSSSSDSSSDEADPDDHGRRRFQAPPPPPPPPVAAAAASKLDSLVLDDPHPWSHPSSRRRVITPRHTQRETQRGSAADAEWLAIASSQLDCEQSLSAATWDSQPLINSVRVLSFSLDTPPLPPPVGASRSTPRRSLLPVNTMPPPSRSQSTTPRRRPTLTVEPGQHWLAPARSAPSHVSEPKVLLHPYYSDPRDVPSYLASALKAASSARPQGLPEFTPLFSESGQPSPAQTLRGLCWLEPRLPAPTCAELALPLPTRNISQSQERLSAGDPSRRTTAAAPSADRNHLRVLSFEVIARARKGLVSDPQQDDVLAVCMVMRDDDRDRQGGLQAVRGAGDRQVVLAVGKPRPARAWGADASGPGDSRKHFTIWVETELALFREFEMLVAQGDPDVLMCWEMQREGLGYLLERAAKLELKSFARALSRAPWGAQDPRHLNDEFGEAEHSALWLTGRHLLNMWRVVREKVKLAQYGLGFCAQALLKRTMASFSAFQLSSWITGADSGDQWRALKHVMARTQCTLAICDHLDVLGQTSELARLFGTDFFSVLIRGSQFKVESVLARVTRQLRFVSLSSTPAQVVSQPAMEGQPLIMEPHSGFYADPVCVLDFRSLYPSVIIAHNLSFDTCLGRLKKEAATWLSSASPQVQFMHEGLGVDRTYQPPLEGLANVVEGDGFIAPNGVCFVGKQLREGTLPRMLSELIEARAMIKAAMRRETDAGVRRVFEARQFGLKDIANTTYGYTAASFSGRMPCAEVADAVVMTGRYYLERAMALVESRFADCKVIYGDTDSLFVQVRGRSLDEARVIGKNIAEEVTLSCPAPIQLNFDKVFMPCVLEMKKRYVGYSHAVKPGERAPFVDAKGIETVRRDACPLVAKCLLSLLKLLFAGPPDLSRCRAEVRLLQTRMLEGRIPDSDYVLTGKVRRAYRTRGPPAAQVARQLQERDPRLKAKPIIKHRQPYVVVVGPKDAPLHVLVVPPGSGRLHNVHYYLRKQILPALNRVFQTMGVDVDHWVADLTTTAPMGWLNSAERELHPGKIEAYFARRSPCKLCRVRPAVQVGCCAECIAEGGGVDAAAALLARLSAAAERARFVVDRQCGECAFGEGGGLRGAECDSLECALYETRRRARQEWNDFMDD